MQPGLPTYVNNSPSGICEQILWLIKNSDLNYSVQETAFSLNICLKKTFLNKWPGNNVPQTKDISHELEVSDKHILNLEKTVDTLNKQVSDLNSKTDDIVTNKLKPLNEEKRLLQVKHEKICANNKILKNENEIVRKELNAANVAVKTCKKETNDAHHNNNNKISGLEYKLRELLEFKATKESEEKELKSKQKKVDKKLKSIQEKEAQIKVERNKLDRSDFKSKKQYDAENNLDKECIITESSADLFVNEETPKFDYCDGKSDTSRKTKPEPIRTTELSLKKSKTDSHNPSENEHEWTAKVPDSVKDWFEEHFKTKLGSS